LLENHAPNKLTDTERALCLSVTRATAETPSALSKLCEAHIVRMYYTKMGKNQVIKKARSDLHFVAADPRTSTWPIFTNREKEGKIKQANTLMVQQLSLNSFLVSFNYAFKC
jgi:hypothetical protein